MTVVGEIPADTSSRAERPLRPTFDASNLPSVVYGSRVITWWGTAGFMLAEAATLAHSLGLGINAGHDLDLDNLVLFRDLPHLEEVSIGHAIISRAVFVGLATVVSAGAGSAATGAGSLAGAAAGSGAGSYTGAGAESPTVTFEGETSVTL